MKPYILSSTFVISQRHTLTTQTHSHTHKPDAGHEDRCLFTGDSGEYYLVFLGTQLLAN
jgi:hypothetical protein